VSSSLPVTRLSPAETAKRIDVLFGVKTLIEGPRNTVLVGVPIPPQRKEEGQRGFDAAVAKLLWPLVQLLTAYWLWSPTIRRNWPMHSFLMCLRSVASGAWSIIELITHSRIWRSREQFADLSSLIRQLNRYRAFLRTFTTITDSHKNLSKTWLWSSTFLTNLRTNQIRTHEVANVIRLRMAILYLERQTLSERIDILFRVKTPGARWTSY